VVQDYVAFSTWSMFFCNCFPALFLPHLCLDLASWNHIRIMKSYCLKLLPRTDHRNQPRFCMHPCSVMHHRSHLSCAYHLCRTSFSFSLFL
jgi:hypothetical protein